jgi:NADH dehydrogenase
MSALSSHRVVIVGGGAGGLELAVRLGRRFGAAHVVLVDTNPFHVWKPSLHEVAAGTLDIHREGLSYAMLGHDSGFQFMIGRMTGVDREARTVTVGAFTDPQGDPILPERIVRYDTLVLAPPAPNCMRSRWTRRIRPNDSASNCSRRWRGPMRRPERAQLARSMW